MCVNRAFTLHLFMKPGLVFACIAYTYFKQNWHGGESDRNQNWMLVITKSFGLVPHRRYIGYSNRKRGGHECRGGCSHGDAGIVFSHEFWSSAEVASIGRVLVTESALAFGGNHITRVASFRGWWVLLI